jgi:hypothetical protein
MPEAPGVEALHDGIHQPGPHSLIPQVWRHGERPEEANAAQPVAKFEPTSSPPTVAANAADGSAAQRVCT